MKEKKHLSIRIDDTLHNKFYYAAKYYGRSGSGQITYLVRKFVEDFEKKNGVITDDDLKNADIK